jgi:hypothetical protein
MKLPQAAIRHQFTPKEAFVNPAPPDLHHWLIASLRASTTTDDPNKCGSSRVSTRCGTGIVLKQTFVTKHFKMRFRRVYGRINTLMRRAVVTQK